VYDRRMTRVATVALVLVGTLVLRAEDIEVMSAGAVEAGLVLVAEQFEQRSGHKLAIQFGTGPQLTARLQTGAVADVLIAPSAVMDTAHSRGRIDPMTRARVGGVGVGIVVRQAAAPLDVGSPDALRRSLISASAVVFNRASTGQHIERLIMQLGIADIVNAKAVRVETGEAVMARIASGNGVEVGFGAMTEIRMLEHTGVRLLAPLPAPLQNLTTYEIAALQSSRPKAAAVAFVQFVTGPEGQRSLRAAGIEPVP
jgi:molybdate transport system substrate-binding protein